MVVPKEILQGNIEMVIEQEAEKFWKDMNCLISMREHRLKKDINLWSTPSYSVQKIEHWKKAILQQR